jgi:hypothetical protein
LLARFDRRFNTRRLEVAVAALATTFVGVLTLAALTYGIYPSMDSASALDHLAGWWANPRSHPMAFIVVFASYVFYTYMILRHAVMGVTIVILMRWASALAADRSDRWFGYSQPWIPVEKAIEELRAGLRDVLISVTLVVSTLLIAGLYVAIPSWLAVAILLVSVVAVPVYLVVPIVEFNRRFSDSWLTLHRRALDGVSEALAGIADGDIEAAHRAWFRLEAQRTTLARVNSLPRLLVDGSVLGKGLVAYFVPVVALGLAMISTRT